MVCRHCPRPPWRPAPIALLLPPLLLTLVLATTHRPHTNTPPPTLTHATPPPTTKATDHHAHQHTHSHHNHHPVLAAVRTDTQCAAVAPLDAESQEALPQEKLPEKCQTCEGDDKCLRGKARCPRLKETLCDEEVQETREEKIRRITLRYCPHLALHSVMCRDQARRVTDTTMARCATEARHLQEIDDMVGRILMQHHTLMAKYDCEHVYSMTQNCTGCQEAYRYWVCSQLFPYYVNGERVKPCRRFCHAVEQKCPYFLPKYKPVAGEPTFLCQDPNIGELEEQESSYGSESCCYYSCSLGAAMGPLQESHDHMPLPTLCSTCNSTSPTTTASSATTTTTTIPATSVAASSAGGSLLPIAPESSEANLKCLSATDSCLLHADPGLAPPLSSSGCPFVLRKHCWTPKALYILLLYLVRTDLWLPRGFT